MSADRQCSCGTDATSLDPNEVVVHGRPCYIAPRDRSLLSGEAS